MIVIQNRGVSSIQFSAECLGADLQLEEREADSPLLAKVRRVRFGSDAPACVVPDGNWDLLFVRSADGLSVAVQSGQIVAPLCEAGWRGTEVLAVSFRPEVYMPRWPAQRAARKDVAPARTGAPALRLDSEGSVMPNSRKFEQLVFALNGMARPIEGDRRFWVGPERLEIPSFESAEQLVAAMARRGLLEKDRVVARALRGVRQRLDERTIQRHFAAVAGITFKGIRQIERAHQAASLLRLGQPAAQVAAELGFTDQSHLSHSVKRILGLTPRQLASR
ncbi:helix-turn-helix transcriptional regulator [Rubrivivax sp. RP6-9]|uniref:helix-turn-helix transcriptional regulator n=1 Tax=Rubrivivax sp. RP6-9 TaxID=3415750 RepID=UPI003CC52246